MKTYQLSASVVVSAYTEVEANSLEEAIKIAEGRSVLIGDERNGVFVDEVWAIDIDEADGEPQNIHEA